MRTVTLALFTWSVMALCTAGEPVSLMWSGKTMKPLLKSNPGIGYYGGSAASRDWRSSPGLMTAFSYSGKGPLPKPKVIVVPLGRELPAGNYNVFVRNFYRGVAMEATLGTETKPIRLLRYDWSPPTLFEVDPAQKKADKLVLRFRPANMVKNSGEKQSQNCIFQGVYITSAMHKIPSEDGKIIELLASGAPKPSPGNALENASFEAGLGHGWGGRIGYSWTFGPEHLDATTAADGKTSVRVPLVKRSRTGKYACPLETRLYRLAPNTNYVLSFYAKSDRPVRVRAQLQGMSKQLKSYAQGGLAGDVTLSREWRRYVVRGKTLKVPAYLYSLAFECRQDTPATLWFDAVQLEPGRQATRFRTTEDVEVGCISSKPGNIFYETEPATLTVRVYNPRKKPKVTLAYKITDYWGKVAGEGKLDIAPAGKHHDTKLSLPVERRGIFRLEIGVAGSRRAAQMVYSVLPPAASQPAPYESGTLSFDGSCANEKHLRIMKRANYHWVHSKFYGRWYIAEPEPGKFRFFDEDMERAKRVGISPVIQTLNPDWGRQKWLNGFFPAKGTTKWLPRKERAYLDAWERFHFALARHYKPWVKYYEIGNEPFCEYSPEMYGRMLMRAYRAIKRADPDAQVVGFSGGGFDEKGNRTAMAAGAKDHFDVVSVHIYPGNNRAAFSFSKFCQAVGKPGWNTETGVSCGTFYHFPAFNAYVLKDYWRSYDEDVREHTSVTALNYLATVTFGRMKRYVHYFARFVNAGPSQPTRWGGSGKENVEFDGSLRANGVALSIASHFFDGSSYAGEAELHENLSCHVNEKAGRGVGFIVCEGRQRTNRAELALSAAAAKLKFFDVMGNPLRVGKTLTITPTPVYFTGDMPARQVLAALRACSVKR